MVHIFLGDRATAAPVDRVEEDLGVVLEPHWQVIHLPSSSNLKL